MMTAATVKTLASILQAVRDYTPDDVAEAVNLYMIAGRFEDAAKFEAARAAVIEACNDAFAFWKKAPQGASSGNLVAVAALRSFAENN